MNCFYLTRYRYYRNLHHPLKFFLFSDIHFCANMPPRTLHAIIQQAQIEQPNYILIAGDLINSVDDFKNSADFQRFHSWLSQLANVAPVLLGLGNHDFYRKNPAATTHRRSSWLIDPKPAYLEKLQDIPNLHVLHNSVFSDRSVYVFGFTPSPAYYKFSSKTESTTLFHPDGEDLDTMLTDFDQLDDQLLYDLPKSKVKIAIVHSPIYLQHPEVASRLAEFDFTLSGHMHNGVVPPLINEFWPSDRGLLAPGKRLFPRHTRTHITSPADKNLILGAVTTIHHKNRPLAILDSAFPVNLATLELSKHDPLLRKPDVKRRYLSFS